MVRPVRTAVHVQVDSSDAPQTITIPTEWECIII
jgi:hypothetical protein